MLPGQAGGGWLPVTLEVTLHREDRTPWAEWDLFDESTRYGSGTARSLESAVDAALNVWWANQAPTPGKQKIGQVTCGE